MSSRIVPALTCLSCLLFAGSYARAGTMDVKLRVTGPEVYLNPITPGFQASVARNSSIELTFSAKSDFQVTGCMLGWRIFSPDLTITDLTWLAFDSVGIWASTFGVNGTTIERRSFDGALPDTFLTGGAPFEGGFGPYSTFQDIIVGRATVPDVDGKLCVDTTFVPPAGLWSAGPGSVVPTWGPYSATGYCLDVQTSPCRAPEFNNPIFELWNTSADEVSYDFDATDGGNYPPENPITWSVTSSDCGIANIDVSTGVFTWSQASGCGELNQQVTITATNSCGASSDLVVNLHICAPPVIYNPSFQLDASYCGVREYYFSGWEGGNTPPADSISWSVTPTSCGVVEMDALTGILRWAPLGECIGFPQHVTVTATNSCGLSDSVEVTFTAIDYSPYMYCPSHVEVTYGRSVTTRRPDVYDYDQCDTQTFTLLSVNPTPYGPISVNAATGEVTFTPDRRDAFPAETQYQVCLQVISGALADTCCFTITVRQDEEFVLRISQTDGKGVEWGEFTDISVVCDAGTKSVGGFDLLVEYDDDVLSLDQVTAGNAISRHNWEYFSGSLVRSGFSFNETSTEKIRMIGMAEKPDRPSHSSTESLASGDTLAILTFKVTASRNSPCVLSPIRFVWSDCSDNVLTSFSLDTTYISDRVFDYKGSGYSSAYINRTDLTNCAKFPTIVGAPCCAYYVQSGLLNPIRYIQFENGGVQIGCDGLDLSGGGGDLNLNGVPNEIADAVIFANYFVQGVDAFNIDRRLQIATTEINGDSRPLTVADLVYLIRVIEGDALPTSKLEHNRKVVTIRKSGGEVVSDLELGAALFVFKGPSEVTLSQSGLELKTGLRNGNTYALVYPDFITGNGKLSIQSGVVLTCYSELLSVETADYDGSSMLVNKRVVPSSFAFRHNYPNPFNPTTKIDFETPVRTSYELSIYNLVGQKVYETTGVHDAGSVSLEWNSIDDQGRPLPSGIYLYQLRVGDRVYKSSMMKLK